MIALLICIPVVKVLLMESTTKPVVKNKGNFVYVNGRPYRGEIKIIKKDGKWLCINILDVEDYLKGVVPSEMHTDKIEALKAQAIVARSYALATKRSKYYDVRADQFDQVYKGASVENPLSTKAVEETRGKVLKIHGKILKAMYSACCGNCKFCRKTPYYRWEKKIKKEELQKKLNLKGKIKKIIIKRDKNKRAKEIIILTNREKKKISGEKFRFILGLKSTLFRIKVRGKEIIVKGRGYGHGAGMCQWGAIKMAEMGYSYRKILKFYFPKAKIKKIY